LPAMRCDPASTTRGRARCAGLPRAASRSPTDEGRGRMRRLWVVEFRLLPCSSAGASSLCRCSCFRGSTFPDALGTPGRATGSLPGEEVDSSAVRRTVALAGRIVDRANPGTRRDHRGCSGCPLALVIAPGGHPGAGSGSGFYGSRDADVPSSRASTSPPPCGLGRPSGDRDMDRVLRRQARREVDAERPRRGRPTSGVTIGWASCRLGRQE
jgi:hypothetical protein